MSYKLYKAKNGLNLLHVPNKDVKLIYVNIGVKIGSDIELQETLEYSHYIEHLFTLLTSRKYNDGLKNRNFLSQNNVKLNAFVVKKYTSFKFTIRNKFFNKFIDMLVNSLYDYYLDEKLFQNEKTSVVEELNSIINSNDYKFETFIIKNIYKKHTREYSEEERLENVKKTKPENILAFFKKYYTPNNMVLSFYGDVSINNILKQINDISPNPTPRMNLYNESKFIITHKKKVNYLKEHKQTCSLNIIFNIPFIFFDYKCYNISAILNILSSDISSILLNRLRNIEGLIYYITTSMELNETNKNLSFLYFETNVESSKIVKVIKIIIEELSKLKTSFLDIKLIKRYKDSIKIKYINDNLTFKPLKLLDNYIKYILWNKNIIKFKDEYVNLGDVDQKKIKFISNKIFNFDNMFIFYNGSKNLNTQINKLIP
jgi:predicted Zn-dependent peptidase